MDATGFLEYRKTIAEVERLCKVEDPGRTPFASKYKALELLRNLQGSLQASLRELLALSDPGVLPPDPTHHLLYFRAAAVSVRIGQLNIETEDPHPGELALLEGIPLLESFWHIHRRHVSPLVNAYNQLGILWSGRNEPEKAAEYLQKADRLYDTYCQFKTGVVNVDKLEADAHGRVLLTTSTEDVDARIDSLTDSNDIYIECGDDEDLSEYDLYSYGSYPTDSADDVSEPAAHDYTDDVETISLPDGAPPPPSDLKRVNAWVTEVAHNVDATAANGTSPSGADGASSGRVPRSATSESTNEGAGQAVPSSGSETTAATLESGTAAPPAADEPAVPGAGSLRGTYHRRGSAAEPTPEIAVTSAADSPMDSPFAPATPTPSPAEWANPAVAPTQATFSAALVGSLMRQSSRDRLNAELGKLSLAAESGSAPDSPALGSTATESAVRPTPEPSPRPANAPPGTSPGKAGPPRSAISAAAELKRPQMSPASSKRRLVSPAIAAYRAANSKMRSSGRRINTVDRLPNGHSRKVEQLHTLTLFYLAQVYQKLRNINLSGRYCRATLERQLALGDYDPVDWGTNAVQLGSYFLSKAAWADACQCFLAAERSFARAERGRAGSVDASLYANLAIGWGKFHGARLTRARLALAASRGDRVRPLAESQNENNDSSLEAQWLDFPPTLFAGSGLIQPEDSVIIEHSSDVPADADGAKTLLMKGLESFAKAREYYVLDGFVSEHVSIQLDVCQLYCDYIYFEPDLERKCEMHKRRVQVLKPLVDRLNPQHYELTLLQLSFQLGEIYSEMVDLHTQIAERAGGLAGDALRKVDKKLTKGIKYFKLFLNLFGKDKPAADIPERVNDNVEAYLRAHFSLARLYHKMPGDNKLMYRAEALREYQFVCRYADLYKPDVMEVEIALCNSMARLLAVELEAVSSGSVLTSEI